MNQGHFFVKEIKWDLNYSKARYIIDWDKENIDFYIISPISSLKVATISNNYNTNKEVLAVPKIRMEISVKNFKGKRPIDIELIKYDSYIR
jgi:hypothetical protein